MLGGTFDSISNFHSGKDTEGCKINLLSGCDRDGRCSECKYGSRDNGTSRIRDSPLNPTSLGLDRC